MMGKQKPTSEEESKQKELLLAVLLNMALAHLKLNKHQKALDECNQVLKLDPENLKGIYRRGLAHFHLRDFDRAEEDFKTYQARNPNDGSLKTYLQEIKKENHLHEQKEKEMYKKMFQ